jgi:hypothetical protein
MGSVTASEKPVPVFQHSFCPASTGRRLNSSPEQRPSQGATNSLWHRGRRSPERANHSEEFSADTPPAGHPDSEQPPAILIDSAAASSRRELRSVLRAARQAVPQLRAAVIEHEMEVPQPDLLVEEGITVVLTSRFSGTGRPRRPAPAGWPCRSVQWGLWELLRHSSTAKSWRPKLFQQSGVPRLSPGTLAGIDAATPTGSFEGRRIKSLLARVKKQVASGRLIVPKLEELPGLVCGGSSSQAPSSILRAA